MSKNVEISLQQLYATMLGLAMVVSGLMLGFYMIVLTTGSPLLMGTALGLIIVGLILARAYQTINDFISSLVP